MEWYAFQGLIAVRAPAEGGALAFFLKQVCLVPTKFPNFCHIHHISYHIETLNIANNPYMEY